MRASSSKRGSVIAWQHGSVGWDMHVCVYICIHVGGRATLVGTGCTCLERKNSEQTVNMLSLVDFCLSRE